jgi:hypothetical protein
MGFEGPHCEYRVVSTNSNFAAGNEDTGLTEGAKAGILLSIFSVVGVIVWYAVYHPHSDIEQEEKVSNVEESDHASSTELDEDDLEHQVVDFDSERIYVGGNNENSEIRII